MDTRDSTALAKAFTAKAVWWVLVGLVLTLLGMQLIPYGRNHLNPPVLIEPAWDRPQTRAAFFRACGDCHSNQSVWPWYSNIAPVSWLVQHDVEEGRSKLNLSAWGSAKQETDEIAEVIQNGSMPPGSYRLLHPAARLLPSEQQALAKGLMVTLNLSSKSIEDH